MRQGINLWDIRFKGERIVYELALNEAIGNYGGNDPFQVIFGARPNPKIVSVHVSLR
jgi:hypothetical protein